MYIIIMSNFNTDEYEGHDLQTPMCVVGSEEEAQWWVDKLTYEYGYINHDEEYNDEQWGRKFFYEEISNRPKIDNKLHIELSNEKWRHKPDSTYTFNHVRLNAMSEVKEHF